MTTRPTAIVVRRPPARKLTSSKTGCEARSEMTTTTSRIGQNADAIASTRSSFMSEHLQMVPIGRRIRPGKFEHDGCGRRHRREVELLHVRLGERLAEGAA